VNLLGTRVDRVRRFALEEWIEAFMESGDPHQIITANLDFVAIARRRPAFARVIDSADLVLCDGKPLQWASQLQGYPLPERVTGMDLVLTTARLSAGQGYSIFLLGAAEGVAERAARKLDEMFPGVRIAGCYSPPQAEFTPDEDAHIVRMIRQARPDALFVALGAPRQDEWIHTHLSELDVQLCAGIGGVFNFLAGETKRAPEWMQNMGMEWVFRLMQEPSRLWRRYLLNDIPIFGELVLQQLTERMRQGSQRPALISAPPYAGRPAPRNGNLRWGSRTKRRSAPQMMRRTAQSVPLIRLQGAPLRQRAPARQ
jgi:N-acetylglucosaminyldiphosphoundecaprenol N-acetyl-beta-D-mannosaminyltransferase